MAGFSYANNAHLVRSNIWSARLKEVLLDQLIGMRYVDFLTDFPDGDTINIPSIGQMETLDYAEGQAIRYTGMDTGNFTFSINKYKSSATYITERMKQDSFYMNRLVSSFVPKMHRAIAKTMEVDMLATGNAGQTAGNLNAINGANHRFIGSGSVNSVAAITPKDFSLANYALNKANVPPENRIAIVDPSVGYQLETMTNLVNVSYNPRWEGVIDTGLVKGFSFVKSVYGFDVYISQNLPQGLTETIAGSPNLTSVTTNGVANIFFSAAADVLPIIGAIRQPPKVDSEYNKDLQREEYVTTCRYDFKLYRPENWVQILTDQTAVA
ncbi:MAG: hypothetical protein KGL39_36440 [Patescibacteria group bacterium]|nr:hypothetical protein [Patescibacteria group bacterium]